MCHNPMNSNPKFSTSWWDPLIKPVSIVINLFLDDKMRSPLTLNKIGVMSSVHGDPTWVILPPGTFTVGFDQ